MPIPTLLTLLCAAQTGNTSIVAEVQQLAKEEKFDAILPRLKKLESLSATEADQIANLVNGTLVVKLEPKNRPLMLQMIREALRKAPLSDPKNVGHWQIRQTEARVLEVLERHDEAMKTLDTTIAQTSDVGKQILGRLRNHLALVGTPAPAIPFGRSLGEPFPGLDKWRGKVVVVDFFAHWCGPCIAAFPEMKALYTEHHAEGLEVLGATEMYGFMGARKDLAPEAEFEGMQGFVKEHALPWPVVFAEPKVKDAYRQMGLPNVVVIDRKGIIREVGYGFYPGEPGKLRSLVKRLLAEK